MLRQLKKISFAASLYFLATPQAFADIPPFRRPGEADGDYQLRLTDYSYGRKTGHWQSELQYNLATTILYYLTLTLAFELPIFYIFGFRSKKSLLLVAIVNVVSVTCLHSLNSFWGGQLASGSGLLIAELMIIVFETAILALFLKNAIGLKKVMLATISANVVSAVIGGILVALI